MKKIFLSLMVLAFGVSNSYAACYMFSNGDGYKVCVHGDTYPDREKAQDIGKKVKGSDCGNVSGYSKSCNGKCVDHNGKVQNSLSGY